MSESDVPSRFDVNFEGLLLLDMYRVGKKLDEGGMGSIYLGENTNLGTKVVIKVPHVRFLGEKGFRARFEREVTGLVKLKHRDIVRILAQGVHDDVPFFVLEYLEGGSLQQRIRAAPYHRLPLDQVRPWLRTIANTLDWVHSQSVVHRDVKPGNVLFDDHDNVFLSDFGIAKTLEATDLSITATGAGVGSPEYAAPEQGAGKDLSPASDQYALAATLYETLSGTTPFGGDTPVQVLIRKLQEDPTPIRDHVPQLPEAAADAIMRALSREPQDRFESCTAFVDTFEKGTDEFVRLPKAPPPPVAAKPESARFSEQKTVQHTPTTPSLDRSPPKPPPTPPPPPVHQHRGMGRWAIWLIVAIGVLYLVADFIGDRQDGPTESVNVIIESPVNPWTNKRTVHVSGKVIGDMRGGRLTINGRPIESDGGSMRIVGSQLATFEADVTHADGEHVIRVEALPRGARMHKASIRVYVDATPPVFEISSPADEESMRNEPRVTIRGQVIDPHLKRIRNDTFTIKYDGTGHFAYEVRRSDEVQHIVLYAEDQLGNHAKSEAFVVLPRL